MKFKLYDFLVEIMIGTFSIKLTQFEQIGSIGKLLISLGNLAIKFHYRN